MATLENNLDSIPCRNCGHPVRPGMIRCRECGVSLTDTGDEFVLAPRVAASAAQRKCSRCGTPREKDLNDCPNCASALLDELMKGAGETRNIDADTNEFDAAIDAATRQTGSAAARDAVPPPRRAQ